jgi:hypothetical protein
MATVAAISIVLGVAMMIPMIKDMLPIREPLVTTIRIYAGTGTDTNGNAPNAAAFDLDGNLIGSEKGGDQVTKGAPYDYKIKMKADGRNGAAAQTHYISLSQAGVDAICIAGISVTDPSDIQFAWYGDVAEFCGAPWYASQTILSSKDMYMPKCVWIDGDATNGIKTKGISLHLPSFIATDERAESMTKDKDLWCNVAPRLKFYDDLSRESAVPVFKPYPEFEPTTLLDKDPAATKDSKNWFTPEWALDKKGRKKDKRSIDDLDEVSVNGTHAELQAGQRKVNFQGQLNKSGNQWHSAKELCESSTSMGPDFVSTKEGVFCDMDHKRAWPLCSATITNGCFDNDNNKMVGGKKNSRRDDLTGDRIIHKRYDNVNNW